MTTFTDSFNRGNGAPGGNWVTISGTPTIAANWLTNNGAASCWLYETTLNDGNRHECTCRVTTASATSNQAGPIVKWSTGPGAGYHAQITYSAGTYSLSILRGAPGSMSSIASTALASAPAGIVTITLVWDNGHLSASLSTGESVSVDDATYASGTYMGVRAHYTTAQVDWVTMIVGAAPAFDVSPDVIPNYGATTELTFTGTNTEWTSGTPGSPTFTCDHGTLSDQSVASATSATATYDPGSYLGPVIFTDPSTGLTATAVVSSDVGVVPPGGTVFSQEAVDYIERSAIAETDPTIANREMNIATSGPSVELQSGINRIRLSVSDTSITGYEVPDTTNLVQMLMEVWRGLNGTLVFGGSTLVPDHADSVKTDTDVLRTSLEEIRGVLEWTLPGILNVIVGEDSISTTHLHDDIAAISAGSNQDVLDALAAYFGANPPTIQQLGTMVSDIATIAGYTLGDVLDAIAAIPGVDLSGITAKLDLIQPTNGNSIDTILTNLATTDGVVDTAAASLASMRGQELLTLQDILDAIALIQPGTPTNAGAPVWPGIAGVTLGTPASLTNGARIEGEMDGVIVAVTTPPTRTGLYQIGTGMYDYGVGRISFESDNGELETWQYLGFRAALFTPKTMVRAAAVHLQVLGGAEGTITPWVVSE